MSTLSMGKFRFAIFAAVIAAAPFSLTAQAQDYEVARMNVPFAFTMGVRHYAPGAYIVRREGNNVLLVRGVSSSGFATMWTEDDRQNAEHGKAIFHRYGDQYFLNEISVAGSSRHIYVRPSKTENRLQIAGNKTAPTGVEIALLEKP